MRLLVCWILAMGAAGCAGDDDALPPVLASSKYIDYHIDTDATVSLQCPESLLAREDRFIERTAATLGVEVPEGRIHFIWRPGASKSCDSSLACYRYRESEGDGLILSSLRRERHELVHAIESPALGADGSRTLSEGIADYLGSYRWTEAGQTDFPAAFKAALSDGDEVDYERAMHFVGSIFTRYGAEKYRELRATVPGDAGPEEFAAAFESIYGLPLDDALAEMTEGVQAVEQPDGCAEGEASELLWDRDGLIDTTLELTCGDPSLYFFGTYDDTRPDGHQMHARFVVQIAEPGYYDLTVRGTADQPGSVHGSLRRCAPGLSTGGVGSLDGRIGHGLLNAGKYALQLSFPGAPEARAAAMVRVEYMGPPPP
ncbi:hypothetical protein [Nannocystis punicea]|uniref:Lipoprotein n=1 Tax=Nannocystis punicea TaxID=2995304 RepID=A0ABY7H3F9_9BACT|nr:hypothetical protein [Nannocystis poenicansa]WAS93794.1 hypothetical protein O0S08_47280 [Nannocystis poenicansa]